jgi:hypothetical protein
MVEKSKSFNKNENINIKENIISNELALTLISTKSFYNSS